MPLPWSYPSQFPSAISENAADNYFDHESAHYQNPYCFHVLAPWAYAAFFLLVIDTTLSALLPVMMACNGRDTEYL